MSRPAGVYGGQKVAGAFRKRSGMLTAPVLRSARNAALEPMLSAARVHLMANRSVHRGVLLKGMAIVTTGKNSSALGATGKAISIAHLVEFGTAPHWQPNRHMMHPGARPKPFLRPAFEEMKGTVIATFAQELRMILLAR